jgi:hypothetical protein
MFILYPDFFPSQILDLGSRIQQQQSKRMGSGMFVPDPDFYPSGILDLKSGLNNNNQRGWEKISYLTFFIAINFKN